MSRRLLVIVFVFVALGIGIYLLSTSNYSGNEKPTEVEYYGMGPSCVINSKIVSRDGRPKDLVLDSFKTISSELIQDPEKWELLIRQADRLQKDINYEQKTQNLLIGGCIANPGFDDQHSILKTAKGEKICTASIVGPKTILLAAHCLRSDVVRVEFWLKTSTGAGGTVIAGWCVRSHGADTMDNVNDVALCLLDKDVSKYGFSGEKFQTVEINRSNIPQSSSLVLAGYGCTESEVTTNELVTGIARSTSKKNVCFTLPNTWPEGKPFWDAKRICTDTSNKKKVTDIRLASVVCDPVTELSHLCKGDSGGPLFRASSGAFQSMQEPKKIIGVASLACMNSGLCDASDDGVSIFADLSRSPTKEFLSEWNASCGEICGVDASEKKKGKHNLCP